MNNSPYMASHSISFSIDLIWYIAQNSWGFFLWFISYLGLFSYFLVPFRLSHFSLSLFVPLISVVNNSDNISVCPTRYQSAFIWFSRCVIFITFPFIQHVYELSPPPSFLFYFVSTRKKIIYTEKIYFSFFTEF